jgi:hypothetical protein
MMEYDRTATLPDLPSELILLGLADLELAEADPRYGVTIQGDWHKPHRGFDLYLDWSRPDRGKCWVNMAGAVMAFSFGVAPNIWVDRLPASAQATYKKWWALTYYQRGRLADGLKEQGITLPVGLPYNVDIPAYPQMSDRGPAEYKSGIRAMAALLAEHGL